MSIRNLLARLTTTNRSESPPRLKSIINDNKEPSKAMIRFQTNSNEMSKNSNNSSKSQLIYSANGQEHNSTCLAKISTKNDNKNNNNNIQSNIQCDLDDGNKPKSSKFNVALISSINSMDQRQLMQSCTNTNASLPSSSAAAGINNNRNIINSTSKSSSFLMESKESRNSMKSKSNDGITLPTNSTSSSSTMRMAVTNTKNKDYDFNDDNLMKMANKSHEFEAYFDNIYLWDRRSTAKFMSCESFFKLSGCQTLCVHFKRNFKENNFKRLNNCFKSSVALLCCENLKARILKECEHFQYCVKNSQKYQVKNLSPFSASFFVCLECATVVCQGLGSMDHYETHSSVTKHLCFVDFLFKRLFCIKCGWVETSDSSGYYQNFFDIFFFLFQEYVFSELEMSSKTLISQSESRIISSNTKALPFASSFIFDPNAMISSHRTPSSMSQSFKTTNTSTTNYNTNSRSSSSTTSSFLWPMSNLKSSLTRRNSLKTMNRRSFLDMMDKSVSILIELIFPSLPNSPSNGFLSLRNNNNTENLIMNSYKFLAENKSNGNDDNQTTNNNQINDKKKSTQNFESIGKIKSVIGLIRYNSANEFEYKNIMLPVMQSLIRMQFFNEAMIALWKEGIECNIALKSPEIETIMTSMALDRNSTRNIRILINPSNEKALHSYLNIIANYYNSNAQKVKRNMTYIWTIVAQSLSNRSIYDVKEGYAGQIARPGILINAIFQSLRSKLVEHIFSKLSSALSIDLMSFRNTYDIDSSRDWPLNLIFRIGSQITTELANESSSQIENYVVQIDQMMIPDICEICLDDISALDIETEDEGNNKRNEYTDYVNLISKSQDDDRNAINSIIPLENNEENDLKIKNNAKTTKNCQCYSLKSLVENILRKTWTRPQFQEIPDQISQFDDQRWIYMILDVNGCLKDNPKQFCIQESFIIKYPMTSSDNFFTQKMRISTIIFRDHKSLWNCAIFSQNSSQVVLTSGKNVKLLTTEEFLTKEPNRLKSDQISLIVLARTPPVTP